MPAQKRAARSQSPQASHRILQALAIALRTARPWRTEPALLPIRQVAAQDGETGVRERFCCRDEQRSLAIRSSAVGQNQPVCVGSGGAMNETTNRWIERDVGEWLGWHIVRSGRAALVFLCALSDPVV